MNYKNVFVQSDPDADDCLAAAEDEWRAQHPSYAGYDLSPEWADEDREWIRLTVPAEAGSP